MPEDSAERAAPTQDSLPTTAHASPVDVAPGPEAADLWWRPGPSDVLRQLGWRWVLVLPAVGVIAFLVCGFFYPALFQMLWWLGLKWGVLALAMPFILLGDLVRRAAAQRREPFCIHCGYSLIGLARQGRCPECGSAYTPQLIEEYRRDPQWFIQRYRARHQLPRRDAPFDAGPVRRRKSKDGT